MRAYSVFQRKWRDYSKKRIETYLRDVVLELEEYSTRRCRGRAEAERQRREEVERQRREETARERHAALVERAQWLEQDVHAWEFARRARRFAGALERAAARNERLAEKMPDGYAAWVRRFADWIDPAVNPSLAFEREFDLKSLLASSTNTNSFYGHNVPDLGELPL